MRLFVILFFALACTQVFAAEKEKTTTVKEKLTDVKLPKGKKISSTKDADDEDEDEDADDDEKKNKKNVKGKKIIKSGDDKIKTDADDSTDEIREFKCELSLVTTQIENEKEVEKTIKGAAAMADLVLKSDKKVMWSKLLISVPDLKTKIRVMTQKTNKDPELDRDKVADGGWFSAKYSSIDETSNVILDAAEDQSGENIRNYQITIIKNGLIIDGEMTCEVD